MPIPSTAIVIVNYRTGDLVVDCLDSLVPEVTGRAGARVIIVDNASGDGSASRIAAAIAARGWDAWARVIESPVNGGFGAGCNVGIRAARQSAEPVELVWLLNPDTRVRPGALAAITAFMTANPAVGIVGTMIEEADGAPWPFAFRFPTILGEIERGMRLSPVSRLLARHAVLRRMDDRPKRVDWVSGASMVVRQGVFDTIGLFDEAYFLYYEETDFCRAAQTAGCETWYLPQARIMHIAGQSTGVTSRDAGRRRMPVYWFESRRRYFNKNHGTTYATLADLAWGASHLVWMLRRTLQRLPDPDPPRLLRDFIASASRRSRHARPVGFDTAVTELAVD
ncbi:glycosyltransferase family 2 protein [Sphingosinicellaceae bacterium]|nr:glycosyltransferase family 2 protein [Sphingosinicellaceae bacterium]